MIKVTLKVPETDMDEWLPIAARVVQHRYQDIVDNGGPIVYGFTDPTRFLICRTTKTGTIIAELRGGNEDDNR